MGRFRFSLLSLLGLVTFLAMGFAALGRPSLLWATLFATTTGVLLVLAILLAVFRRGKLQAFALGFALCGWIYFLFFCHNERGFWDLFGSGYNFRSKSFATSQVLYRAYTKLFNVPVVETAWGFSMSDDNASEDAHLHLERFITIGHSIFLLLLAFLGGLSARWLYGTRESKA